MISIAIVTILETIYIIISFINALIVAEIIVYSVVIYSAIKLDIRVVDRYIITKEVSS